MLVRLTGKKVKVDENIISKPPTGEADEKSVSNSEGSFHSDVIASEIMHYCLITNSREGWEIKKVVFSSFSTLVALSTPLHRSAFVKIVRRSMVQWCS